MIENISIKETATVKDVLQKMDETLRRLLIVVDEDEEFVSLVSLGDIQRYLISHQDFKASLDKVLRKEITVATSHHSNQEIEAMMLKFRTEFMPVLNDEGKLEKVVYWEDFFGEQQPLQKGALNLPVVIMAGGKGTRLRPITHIIPKPLIPVGEKPIMQIIVEQFVGAGCKDFFFSVGYKANMLKAYFDDIEDKLYNITYYSETKPMGTAGSLSLIKDQIDKTFFVSNCDIIIEQDYNEIYEYHKSNNNELTAVAFVKNMKIPYGTFEVKQDGLLESLVEKPEFTFLVNAGLYILEPHLLEEIPGDEFFHITHLMENVMKRNGRIGVFPINEGAWLDIGQWKEYQKTLRKYGEEIQF